MDQPNIITYLFTLVDQNNHKCITEILSDKTFLVNSTMPLNFISTAFEWVNDSNMGNPSQFIKDAIEMHLQISLLEWSIIQEKLESFLVLLKLGAIIREKDYNRAIALAFTSITYVPHDSWDPRELNRNKNDIWLYALLKHRRTPVPFNSIEYCLAISGIDGFNFLYADDNNVTHAVSNITCFGKTFTMGLLADIRDAKLYQLLIEKGVMSHSGDIFKRLENSCVNFEMLETLLTKFVEEHSMSETLFDIFTVSDKKVVISNYMNKAIMKIYVMPRAMGVWNGKMLQVLQNVIKNTVVNLPLLAYEQTTQSKI